MMKHVYKKIVVVICTLVFLFGSMFEPFTCAGFRPVRSFVVHAEEDPGTTTATNTGIAALIAILMASGIRFVGDYETVIQPAVTQLWDDFSDYAGNQLSLAQLGAGIAISQGYLRVSSSVNNAVAGFQSWYQNTFNVPNTGNVSISVPGEMAYTAVPATYTVLGVGLQNINVQWKVNTSGADVRAVAFGQASNGFVYLVSKVYNDGVAINWGSNTNYPTTNTQVTVDGVNYYYARITSTNDTRRSFVQAFINTYGVVNAVENAQNAIAYTWGASAGVGDISMQGQTYDLKDGYQLENDQAKLLDIAGLAALAAALGLALENVTDLVNDIPLIYGYPWAQDFPDVYPDTPADTIPWVDTPTSVIPADTPEYVPTTPSDTDSYKVLGLERVFPFSIPFDLYYLIQAFSASPETPNFTIGMYNPSSRRMETQEINLQQFESYAQIFRVFVTAMYILALILITRKLIRS